MIYNKSMEEKKKVRKVKTELKSINEIKDLKEKLNNIKDYKAKNEPLVDPSKGKEPKVAKPEVPLTEEEKKKKKKKLIFIIIITLLAFLIIGAALAYYFIQSTKLENLFHLKNVDATVTIKSYIQRGGNSIPITINGKEETVLVFDAEDTSEDNNLNKSVEYDDQSIHSGDKLVFFYTITNTSDAAAMYIDFMKRESDDTNFTLAAYYAVNLGTTITKLYYCLDGMYYSTNDSAVQGVSSFVIGSEIKLNPGDTFTMRIEFEPTDMNQNSYSECNFRFDLINEQYYNQV